MRDHTSRLRNNLHRYSRLLVDFSDGHNLLGIAYVALILVIFLGHRLSAPVFFYLYFFLPPTILVLVSVNRQNIKYSLTVLSCVIYLISLAVSSYLNIETEFSMLFRQIRYSIFISIFLIMTGYLCVYYEKFIDYLIFVSVIGLALNASINMYYYLIYMSPYDTIWTVRLTTNYGMPEYANSTNISVTYAVYFVGSIATIARTSLPKIQRIVLFLAAMTVLVALLMTHSRSAYVGVAVGISVLVLAASRRNQIIAAVILLVSVAGLASVPEVWNTITARGLSHRPEVWSKFIDVISIHPLAGYGSFSTAGITLYSGQFLDQAHNLVLSAWFRGGFVGAVSMVCILMFGNYWAVRLWQTAGQITPLCMMVTITAAGLVDYQLIVSRPTWPWVTFWLPFGLCIGAEMIVRHKRNVSPAVHTS